MIIEKDLKKNLSLELPKELLKKANLFGKVSIIVEENEIIIKKVSKKNGNNRENGWLGERDFQ